MTIDSLQAQFGALHGPGSPPGAIANPNCPEPVNFAYLTKNGTPIIPLGYRFRVDIVAKDAKNVLRMNQGDVITVNIHDTAAGLSAAVADQSTGGAGRWWPASPTASATSCSTRCTDLQRRPVRLPPDVQHRRGADRYRPADRVDDLGGAHLQHQRVGRDRPLRAGEADGDDHFCIHGPLIPGCRYRH